MGRPTIHPVREDGTGGTLRWCGTCAEWWPNEYPFWRLTTYHAGDIETYQGRTYERHTDGVAAACRVHTGEMNEDRVRALLRERRDQARVRGVERHRCHGTARHPECPVMIPIRRTRCYGCEGVTVGALTIDVLRQRLAA